MFQNTETHRLNSQRIACTLSIGCDLYLQFHDSVEMPQRYEVTHLLCTGHFFFKQDQTVIN